MTGAYSARKDNIMENRQFTRPIVKIQALNDNFYEGEITQESLEKLAAEPNISIGRELLEKTIRSILHRAVELAAEDFDEEFEYEECMQVLDLIYADFGENLFEWDFYDAIRNGFIETKAKEYFEEILENRDKYYEVEVRVNKTYLIKVKATNEYEARRIIREYGVDDAAEDYGDETDSDYEIYEAEELDYEPECYLEW